MKLAVITPVGPGHHEFARMAERSVRIAASKTSKFSFVDHLFQYEEGRGVARNAGMKRSSWADWYLFLDADDTLHHGALSKFEPVADVVFGPTTSLRHGVFEENRTVGTWDDLFKESVVGVLDWGFFRGEPARKVGFMDVDTWDDYEFWLAMASEFSWVKCSYPIRLIGSCGSSFGPRGYQKLDWQSAVAPIREHWKERGRVPMNREERCELARRIGKRPGVRE